VRLALSEPSGRTGERHERLLETRPRRGDGDAVGAGGLGGLRRRHNGEFPEHVPILRITTAMLDPTCRGHSCRAPSNRLSRTELIIATRRCGRLRQWRVRQSGGPTELVRPLGRRVYFTHVLLLRGLASSCENDRERTWLRAVEWLAVDSTCRMVRLGGESCARYDTSRLPLELARLRNRFGVRSWGLIAGGDSNSLSVQTTASNICCDPSLRWSW